MGKRVHLHISFDTALAPSDVIDALTDFSAKRLQTWPTIDQTVYELHDLGDGWADVTEGSAEPAVWARERYDWSGDRVSIKAIESNFCTPGDGTELVITPNGTGSHVELDWEREAASAEWQPAMDAMATGGTTLLLDVYRGRFEALAAARR